MNKKAFHYYAYRPLFWFSGGLPNPLDADPPVGRPPPDSDPQSVNRMTDPSENITLPQTSFVGST